MTDATFYEPTSFCTAHHTHSQLSFRPPRVAHFANTRDHTLTHTTMSTTHTKAWQVTIHGLLTPLTQCILTGHPKHRTAWTQHVFVKTFTKTLKHTIFPDDRYHTTWRSYMNSWSHYVWILKAIPRQRISWSHTNTLLHESVDSVLQTFLVFLVRQFDVQETILICLVV